MKSFRILVGVAVVLAFMVVMLGAYTRLTNAGLGCPDWPGCYGRMVLPSQTVALTQAQQRYPDIPIESHKAWTEMAHRYAAGTLALLVVCITFYAWRYRRRQNIPWGMPAALLILIGFQAALGMWTVTLKLLPIVVMGHLLGGLLIFGCLVYLCWWLQARRGAGYHQWRFWVDLGLVIVFCQIALGGWVSSNYAGLACIGFPRCNGQWLPVLDWHHSFQFWSSLGVNYQGGVLDAACRVTIQMVHRMGAGITALYLLVLSGMVLRKIPVKRVRRVVMVVLGCLSLQWVLGIVNVWYWLPLWAAVAHNGVAALLLAAMLSLRYCLITEGSHAHSA